MRPFDPAQAATVVELQQFLFDFGYEIDAHLGRDMTDYYAEDGVFALGEVRYEGHAAIARFYAEHGERIRSTQKDGVRQVLHALVNVRVTVHDATSARLDFFNINYAASGARPVIGATTPNMIVECRMDVRREPGGPWHVTLFESRPQFMAEDPFAARLVTKG